MSFLVCCSNPRAPFILSYAFKIDFVCFPDNFVLKIRANFGCKLAYNPAGIGSSNPRELRSRSWDLWKLCSELLTQDCQCDRSSENSLAGGTQYLVLESIIYGFVADEVVDGY